MEIRKKVNEIIIPKIRIMKTKETPEFRVIGSSGAFCSAFRFQCNEIISIMFVVWVQKSKLKGRQLSFSYYIFI